MIRTPPPAAGCLQMSAVIAQRATVWQQSEVMCDAAAPLITVVFHQSIVVEEKHSAFCPERREDAGDAVHPPLITLMGGIMRKTPVSAARQGLKFGGISERKQTELIHHPVCSKLTGVCLPFGWKEINRLALTSGNIVPSGCASAD